MLYGSICVLYDTIIRLVDQLGLNHDANVKEWREEISTDLQVYTQYLVLILEVLGTLPYQIYFCQEGVHHLMK